MNEKNETTGGEHNADTIADSEIIETPIHIKRGALTTVTNTITDGKVHTLESSECEILSLSLSEALRVIEATVKFLNQTKNEGRHEIRTNKDKENQKALQGILDVCNGKQEDSQHMDKTELGKFIFEIKNIFSTTIDKNTHTYIP